MADTRVDASDYAALNLVWAGLLGGLLAGTRAAGAEAPPLRELPLYALASFAFTKAVAKEKIGLWVREPVVEHGRDGTRPKGRGLRYATGELLTCTRCLGTWSSLGLVGLRVARPREGRIVATVLASAALNDWMQTGFTWTCRNANLAERRLEEPAPAAATPQPASAPA